MFGQRWAEGVPCAITDPRAERHFAEAVGKLEKIDRIDCAIKARTLNIAGP